MLELLVRATADDDDARSRWADALLCASADARGAPSLDRKLADEVRAASPESEAALSARVAAVEELAAFAADRTKRARSHPDDAIVAWWADELARRLARGVPALAAALPSDPTHTVVPPPKLESDVAKDLKQALKSAQGSGRVGESIRLARLLAGLGYQANSDELQNDAPSDAKSLQSVGADALERAREKLLAKQGAPLTVDELLELDLPDQLVFTREHADFANPGVAVSPTGLYRVETICGYETLLGAASTVEEHHRRLVAWYGRDPFAERPGTLRIDPEMAGLESESPGFWWAPGFQRGDLTVLRFACGTIAGLGRGITHELTHRFDGLLYPGLPSWLLEGRAVWTAAAYEDLYSEEFVENAVSAGMVETAYIKGYGDVRNLRKLLDGTIDDYRDNYPAGHALFVYLRSWPGASGAPLFAANLEPYMQKLARVRGTPVELFEAYFADGKDGRPAGLEAFATGFVEFLRGFYWQSRAPWIGRYATDVGNDADDLVFDEPSWSWARRRAEPFYGDEHAFHAGRVLAEIGKDDAAVAAFTWSTAADERVRWRLLEIARFLDEHGARDAAWVLRNDVDLERRRALDTAVAEAPFLAQLPRTRRVARRVRERRDRRARVRSDRRRRPWLGRHDELAAALGAPLLLDEPAPRVDATRSPHEPWRVLGLGGWSDVSLTDYEERRVPGLWYVDEQRDVHVGREAPRKGTGTLDRTAHQRDAVAMASDWMQPGRYRVRCRVEFTTSFVSGALVLGYTRRDRNLRLHFSAGDFLYAIGSAETTKDIDGVGWRVDGLRDREGALIGSVRGGDAKFDTPRENFELEVVVDGACAHVWIEGEEVATYHTPDGAPIEGHIGFATGMGAIRVIEPRVQRLDATWRLDTDPSSHVARERLEALDVRRPPTQLFDRLLNRPVLGVPVSPHGTLLSWVPLPDVDRADQPVDVDRLVDRAQRQVEKAVDLLDRYHAAVPLVVAVPELIGDAPRDALTATLRELRPDVAVVTYPGGAIVFDPDDESDPPAAAEDWLLFVDATGVLRFATGAGGTIGETGGAGWWGRSGSMRG
ncbi:MAG: hypothetical protein R3F34_15695 [Planctomycetota bacterium]